MATSTTLCDSPVSIEVRVKGTETVRPAGPTPRRTVWCANPDLLVPLTHTPTVYFYRPDGSPGFMDAAVLKSALAEVLMHFYPAAGRKRLDGDGRPEIDCNGEGVVFVEAEASVGLEGFGDFGPENGPNFMQLVPRPAAFGSERDISACPFLLLQLTRFRCGGASLGVAFDHLVADGFAALHLINSWADAARRGGGGVPATPPVIDRTVFAARQPPVPSFPHPEYTAPPCLSTPLEKEQPLVRTRFRLAPDEINRLKARGGVGGRCGSYEAIVAHVWRSVCIARELPAEQRTRLYMPLSVLRRVDPPLPPNYLGNALFSTVSEALAGAVTGDTVEQVVGRVRAALAKVDDAYVRSAVDYIEAQPVPERRRRGGSTYSSPNLNVNSWVQLPIYGADFGWGRPVFMGPARVLCEGMVYILPCPDPHDGLWVLLALQKDAMKRFRKVFYDF
uniref:Hydroxycinnamoyl-Coenzyme A shikimate/quinate hydroxycinnamoyltransferase n=1 Tax=Anthurium amnicola TaxID=1678845 RepID=A0A1D1ZED2_9ARAE